MVHLTNQDDSINKSEYLFLLALVSCSEVNLLLFSIWFDDVIKEIGN